MQLYNISKDEARVLADYFNDDPHALGLAIWSKGKVSNLETAMLRAHELITFSKEG